MKIEKRWIVKDLTNTTVMTHDGWDPVVRNAFHYSCEDYARAALEIRLEHAVAAHKPFGGAFEIVPIYVPKVNRINGTPYKQLTQKPQL